MTVKFINFIDSSMITRLASVISHVSYLAFRIMSDVMNRDVK
jgi:hypothetical protein